MADFGAPNRSHAHTNPPEAVRVHAPSRNRITWAWTCVVDYADGTVIKFPFASERAAWEWYEWRLTRFRARNATPGPTLSIYTATKRGG